MKDPLGVSPSKGHQGTTRGKEKFLLTSVGIEPTTSGLDLPLLCRLSYEVGQRTAQHSIFETLEDSCGPRIWQALIIVNVYAPAIAKCLQENLSTSDLQPVSNKQMSNAYGGIGFCKEEAKTFAQLLLHWDHGMNNGRPIKIPFL